MEQNIGNEGQCNAEQNMESDRAKFAGKISKRPKQIWARPSMRPFRHVCAGYASSGCGLRRLRMPACIIVRILVVCGLLLETLFGVRAIICPLSVAYV